MTKISAFHKGQCQNSPGELGDLDDSGRLRCLHGKRRHHQFHVCVLCTCIVGSALVFWVCCIWP